MNDFKYGIEVNDKVIAGFVNECDRDYSLDCLAEIFDDCTFIPVDLGD